MSTRQQYLSSMGILTIFLRLFQITISEVTSDSSAPDNLNHLTQEKPVKTFQQLHYPLSRPQSVVHFPLERRQIEVSKKILEV